MKTVVYYTSPYFLDISLEVINTLKRKVALHVLIEVTPNSMKANILDLDHLPADKTIVPAGELLNEEQGRLFDEYFDGCRSVSFVVHAGRPGKLNRALEVSSAVKKAIRDYAPDVIHFESFSVRTIPLLPLLFSGPKIVFSIHDGQLHSGEKNWKDRLARFLFLRLTGRKVFVFYSEFTKNQFLNGRKMAATGYKKLQIQRYSFWKKLRHCSLPSSAQYILFFGRISRYKGVPLLLDAMPEVWKQFPEVPLMIAGRGNDPGVANHPLIQNKDSRVRFINRHIHNDELAGLICNAITVVCPYTDASQSGVLWTTFGLNKPVVATDVGAFGEFIRPGFNGFLIGDIHPEPIAKALIDCLSDNRFLELEKNLSNTPCNEAVERNGKLLLELY